MDFAIEIRLAETLAEREKYGIAGTDQAALVSVDGEVVAWCDDYLSAHLIAGTAATPTAAVVETLMSAVQDFWQEIA